MTRLFPKRMFQILTLGGLSALVWWHLSTRLQQADLTTWPLSSDLEVVYLVIALILMPVNWGLETIKFRTLLASASDLKPLRLYQSIHGGIAVSMLLPNRMGEFIGRLVFFPSHQRPAALSATLTGSVLQSMWILAGGGWVLMHSGRVRDVVALSDWGLFGPTLLVLILLATGFLVFFRPGWRDDVRDIWRHFRIILGNGAVTAASFWALCRYATFTFQFALLLQFTGVDSPWIDLVAWSALVFLFQTILPLPPALGWIGRLELAIGVGGFMMIPPVEAAIASLLLWLINLALPGVYGGYVLLEQQHYKHLNHVRTAYSSR